MRFTSWKKVTYRLLATVISDRVCIHTICREPWVRSQDCECSISSTLQCAVYKRSTPSPSLSDCLPRWQAVSAYFLSDLFLFHLVNGILVSPVISSNMCLFFRWNLEPSSTMFSSLMMQSLPKNLGRAPGERQRWALKLVMFYLFNCICSYQLSFSQLCSTIYGLQKKKEEMQAFWTLVTLDVTEEKDCLFLVMVASLLAFRITALLENWTFIVKIKWCMLA